MIMVSDEHEDSQSMLIETSNSYLGYHKAVCSREIVEDDDVTRKEVG